MSVNVKSELVKWANEPHIDVSNVDIESLTEALGDISDSPQERIQELNDKVGLWNFGVVFNDLESFEFNGKPVPVKVLSITKEQHDAAVNTIAQWNVQTAQADGVGEGDYDLVSEYTNDSFEEINIKVKEIVLG